MTVQIESGLHHIAQINIARLRYDRDDPRAADFFDNLDRINALADQSEGFVWRLMDEEGNATGIDAFDDPGIIINMSVWQSVDVLKAFAYQTVHHRFVRRRTEWFIPAAGPSLALWWVAAGQNPAAQEGRRRLEYLTQNGPSPHAFTFSCLFDPVAEGTS